MKRPKISVVLPVYNGEKYLSESIDSVLGQEFVDYEFLICDDGSTDNTAKIIKSKQDARIRFLKNETNRGLFKTINRLIRISTGEHVRLWSSDDIMRRDCLKEETEFCGNHCEIGFCYCARDLIDDSGRVVLKAPRGRNDTPEIIPGELAAQIMFYYGSIAGNISSVTIKKAVLDETGLFREDMTQSGDFEMWDRISKRYPIGFINKPLIKLRTHRNQYSRVKGASAVFMREDQEIIASLMRRLPSEIIPYARAYNRWHRHTQYAHYMVSCFTRGNFKTAFGIYRQMCRIGNPFLAVALWILTANGHFFKKKPRFALQTDCPQEKEKMS